MTLRSPGWTTKSTCSPGVVERNVTRRLCGDMRGGTTHHAATAGVFSGVGGVGSVTAETSPETVEAWESMSHLNLMLSLESQFGISIEPEEIPTLVSVQAIADKVETSSA